MIPSGHSLRAARDRALWTLFGDRTGLAIFLGALVFFALTWRTDFLINDNYTIANAMVGLSEGHLYIDRAFYKSVDVPSGPTGVLTSPGTSVHDGRLYGENYGQLFLALPVLWGLRAVAAVADLRIAIVGVWSLLVLAFALQVGTLFDRRRAGAIGGSAVALVLFAVNVALAPDLAAYWIPFVSLHVGSMVAAGFVGVLLYRLVGELHDRRAGAFAGALVVLATPVGFWAAVPMRHATTAALALATVYWFHRSRVEDGAAATRFRALAYAPVGLTAWVFAPEGLMLLVALVAVDLATARSNAPRELVPVGLVAGLALVPFFLTNLLVAGNPLEPPVLVEGFLGERTVELARQSDLYIGNGTPGGGAGNGSGGATGGTTPDPGNATAGSDGGADAGGSPFVSAVSSVPSLALLFLSKIADSLAIFVTEPGRVYHTFLRGGHFERLGRGGGKPIELALLEAMPVAAALVALPVAAARLGRTGVGQLPNSSGALRARLSTPERSTDLLVVAYVAVLISSYMPSLPLHAQFTVRYLVPATPLLLYGAFRTRAVRRPLTAAPGAFAWSYGAGVLVGGQVLVAYLASTTATLGELVQFHALLALALAAPLAAWVAVSATGRDPDPRGGAALFGLAAAATTVFVLLAGTQYFATPDDLVIPISRSIAREVSLA